MASADVNGDDEIELQRIRMEKIMVVDYKSTEGTYRGSLSPSKVASMMMGSPTDQKNGVVSKAEGKTKYFIMLRNTNTGEECLHYEAVESLEGWHLFFINKPILERINIMKEPRFPPLRAPTAEEMWAHVFMIKGRDRFMVVVTATCPWMKTEPVDSLQSVTNNDIVVLRAMSPLIPSTHAEYKKISTSQGRKACAMQYAFKVLGEKSGFSCDKRENNLSETEHAMMTSILHGDAVVNQGGWYRYEMSGAFYSNSSEQTAGSATIPLALQKMQFLLFGVDNQDPLKYSIILPHRYSYVFQLPCVAGWKVIGGVNMNGEWQAMTAAFTEKNLNNPITERNVGSQGSLFGLCCPDALADFINTVEDCMTECTAAFQADVHKEGLTAKFPDIKQMSSEEDRDKLSAEAWQSMLTYVGLNMILEKLMLVLASNMRQKSKHTGDIFLASLIDSYASSTTDRQPMLALSDACLMENVDIMFRLCKGCAENFIREGDLKTQKEIDAKLKETEWKPLTIDMKKLIPFLRELMGSTPESWAEKVTSEFTPGIFYLVQNVILKPGYYSSFFPNKTWGSTEAFYDLIYKAPTFNENIAKAFTTMVQIHEKPDKKGWSREMLVDALACRLLMSDRTKL